MQTTIAFPSSCSSRASKCSRKTIQKNKESKEKQISNLVDTIENRGGNSQLYQRLDTRENELKHLVTQLEGLDESFQDQLQFLNAPERIIACALDLRTYIESEDPEIARPLAWIVDLIEQRSN